MLSRWPRGAARFASTNVGLSYSGSLVPSDGKLFVIGRHTALEQASQLLPAAASQLWPGMLKTVKAGQSKTLVVPDGDEAVQELVLSVLPGADKISRHNTPSGAHNYTGLLKAAKPGDAVLVLLDSEDHAYAAGCAVARGFPLYTAKTSDDATPDGEVQVAMMVADAATGTIESISAKQLETVNVLADAIRLTQRLVDTPPSDGMACDGLVLEAEAVAASLPTVSSSTLRYDQLKAGGFGGLEAVGRAAARDGNEPALVVLSHTPASSTKCTALVGKGIVYDTGGLSLKPSDSMCGMKTDMVNAHHMCSC